jgi:hypothetical protein
MSAALGFPARLRGVRIVCKRRAILGGAYASLGLVNIWSVVSQPTVWQGIFAGSLVLVGLRFLGSGIGRVESESRTTTAVPHASDDIGLGSATNEAVVPKQRSRFHVFRAERHRPPVDRAGRR